MITTILIIAIILIFAQILKLDKKMGDLREHQNENK